MAISTEKLILQREANIHAEIVSDFDGTNIVVPGVRAVGGLSAASEKFAVNKNSGAITTLKGVALPVVDAALVPSSNEATAVTLSNALLAALISAGIVSAT